MSERIGEAVGIDLGTTYSSLAYVDSQGLPRVVADSSGQTVMPSVVFFDDADVIVGEVALSHAHLRAERVVQFIKVHMGDPWREEFNGTVHTPESVSALILCQLVREAEQQIGPIRQAVITVPAYFTEKRRRATQQAGEIAGLEVIGTLNEPISAALAYGLHLTTHDELAVIYDLGGGTFDVTVVRITPNELVELATAGNRQLGGRDWDQILTDEVSEDFKRVHGVDPRTSLQTLQDLMIESEKAKRRLSKMQRTAIRLQAFGHDHTTEITRDRFESITAPLLQATRLTTELALEDARLTWRDVSRVVLVGGSTNMPAVRRMLKDVSGIQPDTAVNPVTAVALGAAIYARMLEVGSAPQTFQALKPTESAETPPAASQTPATANVETNLEPSEPASASVQPRLTFVTAHGVGIKTRADQSWANTVLIHKNSRVPTMMTKRFFTKGDGVKGRFVTVEITQGDARDVNLVEVLGTGRIELPGGEPPGNPVDVTMEFDDQGRLHTRAVHVNTGKEIRVTLELPGSLCAEEVAGYQNYMEQAGYERSFSIQAATENLQSSDDDED